MSNSVTTSKRRLGDCLSFIVDNRGKTPPLSEQGIELIEINAIPGNRKSVDFDAVKKHVSEDTYNTWFRKGHPQVGDTLISTVGAIGRVAFVGKQRGCIAQNVIAMRPDVNLVDPGYLFYVLSSDAIQTRLNSLNIGVAQPSLKVPHLLNVELEVPDLSTQRKISGILSAYDDLIENNLRRIKILEDMAQSLYREWFVHFRFPGHESAKFVDCGPGRIPEGWRPASLGSLCKTIREKFDETRDSELPLLDLSRMPSKTLAPSEFGASGDLGTSRILFKAGDTLFGSIRPYLHKVCRAPVSGITNVSVLVLRPLDNRYSALVSTICSTCDAIQWAEQHSTGLKMPVIKWDQLAKFPISLPSESILNRFDSFVSPAMAEIGSLSQRNLFLRATRDLLLTKLLSA